MARPLKLAVSKGEVNRAGDTIRAFMNRTPDGPTPVDFVGALDVLVHWRACHAYPLTKAAMGLRSMVSTADALPADVAQRLKRLPTIVDKLRREPAMSLSRMHDIGGCRAVVPDLDALARVRRRLERNSHYRRTIDYIENPKHSGYRGVHVVARYDDRDVEIQLRTRVQHEWAFTVERMAFRTGYDLKSGQGSPEWLEFFRLAADLMGKEEMGEVVTEEDTARLDDARRKALLSNETPGGALP